MFTFITLPDNFTAEVASSTNDTLGTFSPLTVTIITVLLAGLILEIIITSIRHK